MKKLFFTVLILLISFQVSNAQFHLALGPVTGLNFNIATGPDVKDATNGLGFVFGGTVDMDFSPTVGLMTNVQFYDNRSGSSSTSGTTGNGTAYTIKNSGSIAYFEIEPLFKLSLLKSMFYFFVGPSFGINMESSYEVTVTSANDNVTFQDGSKKQTGSIKNMNARFELKIGSGLNIPISENIWITPAVSFGYGLTKVQSDVDSRIMTIQALCGVKFRLQ
ncbi:MAG: outer membrane beta-barrel protein [Melioribacteraceae bacterium]